MKTLIKKTSLIQIKITEETFDNGLAPNYYLEVRGSDNELFVVDMQSNSLKDIIEKARDYLEPKI